jgi:hypothetical protein
MRYRPLVAQTDASRLAPGGAVEPLPVGIVRWPSTQRRVTVVVKASYAYEATGEVQTLRLASRQTPLTLAEPRRDAGAGDSELAAPNDLVAAKLGADVLVVGHAFGPGPRERHAAAVRLGDWSRAFATVGTADDRMPLTRQFLRDLDGGAVTEPLGPSGPWLVSPPPPEASPERKARFERRIAEELARRASGAPAAPPSDAAEAPRGWLFASLLARQRERAAAAGDGAAAWEAAVRKEAQDEQRFEAEELEPDWEDLDDPGPADHALGTHFATELGRTGFVAEDAVLETEGLEVGGERRRLQLANQAPLVAYEAGDARYQLDMLCDTLVLDTDARRVTLVWRGQAPVDADAVGPQRIVVSLEDLGAIRALGTALGEVARSGRFARAVDEETLAGAEPGLDGDVELELARAAALLRTPEPRLTLDQYAAVTAELAGARDRSAVLARHGLDAHGWSLEESAWLERVGRAMRAGDLDTPMALSRAVQAARRARRGAP